MGWCRIEYLDKEGRVTHVEQIGDDPLAEGDRHRSVRKETHSKSWRTDGNDPDAWGE